MVATKLTLKANFLKNVSVLTLGLCARHQIFTSVGDNKIVNLLLNFVLWDILAKGCL